MRFHHLRKLKTEDVPRMLEWMHHADTTRFLDKDFAKMTRAECERFIRESLTDHANAHFAMADEEDRYLGTVSLKNIKKQSAEFAIVTHMDARGKDVASEAMREVLQLAGKDYGIHTIYWYVSRSNERALRFYDTNGYQREEDRSMLKKLTGGVQN